MSDIWDRVDPVRTSSNPMSSRNPTLKKRWRRSGWLHLTGRQPCSSFRPTTCMEAFPTILVLKPLWTPPPPRQAKPSHRPLLRRPPNYGHEWTSSSFIVFFIFSRLYIISMMARVAFGVFIVAIFHIASSTVNRPDFGIRTLTASSRSHLSFKMSTGNTCSSENRSTLRKLQNLLFSTIAASNFGMYLYLLIKHIAFFIYSTSPFFKCWLRLFLPLSSNTNCLR